MERRCLLAGLAAVLLISGCAGKPGGMPVWQPVSLLPEQPEEYQIIDYKKKEEGGTIPSWVNRYLEGGIRGVEELPEYGDKYVFVSGNHGNNRRTLEQWQEHFTVAQDFARLAAARIEARFSGAATAYPDDEYGGYFELLVKTASDSSYEGAIREDDFWVLRQYFGDDEAAISRESYDFLILITIDKSLFEPKIRDMLNYLNPVPPPTREQTAAIQRVRDTFFDGF